MSRNIAVNNIKFGLHITCFLPLGNIAAVEISRRKETNREEFETKIQIVHGQANLR